MASLADEFKEEARSAKGRAVFRDVQGWRFGLSFGLPVEITREEFDHVVSGRGSKYSQSVRKRLASTTYEEFIEQTRIERETAEAMGTNDRTWTISASLWPRGRSSTTRDWDYLGQMLAAIGAPLDSCKTPVETTHPNDVHYWIWEERPNGEEDEGSRRRD